MVVAAINLDPLTVDLAEHELTLARLQRALGALKLSLEREAAIGGYTTPEQQLDYRDAVALLVECGATVDYARERAEVAYAAWTERTKS